MKPFSIHTRRSGGFTLVELLVVMGIIAILAGVIVASVSSVLRFAKRTKANSTCTMIQTAVQSCYTEYSVYPTANPSSGTDDYYDGASSGAAWQDLTIALCGNVDPYTGLSVTTPNIKTNTRAIGYLSLNHSDINSTFHAPQNPFGSGMPAPYFYMSVDTDYSGRVGDTGTAPPNFSSKYVNTPVAAGPIMGGVAVWCSCDQAVPATTTELSASWVHTY